MNDRELSPREREVPPPRREAAPPDPVASLSAAGVMALQRTAGNQATARLLARSGRRALQRTRDWVGLDAQRYHEEGGAFARLEQRGDGFAWAEIEQPLQQLERELISQYFGGIERAEKPPETVGRFVGIHVKRVGVDDFRRPQYLTGIVGAWDSGLAKTGHAMGTGNARQNQYGDGIYVINPGRNKRDYQDFEQQSYVYDVYAIRGRQFTGQQDQDQTAFTDPEQFKYFCFVRQPEVLPSVRQVQQARQNAQQPPRAEQDPQQLAKLQEDKAKGFFSLF